MIGLLLMLAAQDEHALHAGRIITITGADVEGGYIHVRDGRIVSVGRDAPAVRIVELGDAVVMPGIVDAASPIRYARFPNEEESEITPDVNVVDLVEPDAFDFSRARDLGVTTVYLAPAGRNVVGGLGAVFKTRGATVEEMLVRPEAALQVAMGSGPSEGNWPPRSGGVPDLFARRPTTRMGLVWEFRNAFFHARENNERTLIRALDGEQTVRVTARLAADIETGVRLAEEFGLRIVLEDAVEADRLIEFLRGRDIPVVLLAHVRVDRTRGAEWSQPRLDTAARLMEAGVRVAIRGADLTESDSPLAIASFLTRYGVTREQALRAVTRTPAEILGVADRVGSIEAGRDADFVVLSGDPLSPASAIRAVVIQGQVVSGSLSN